MHTSPDRTVNGQMFKSLQGRLVLLILALGSFMVFPSVYLSALPSIGRMTVNGRVSPLGISHKDISLSWAIQGEERGMVQRAYRVRIGKSPAAMDVWDSGRVESDRQIDLVLPADISLHPATRYWWQVKIWDGKNTASEWSAPAWFETGLEPADWSGARWISHVPPDTVELGEELPGSSLPLFRKAIKLRKSPVSARLYASAQGVYQLSVNGLKVGDQFLSPGWTDYGKRIQTQTYDVTSLLQAGDNVIGAALGDGWYLGKVGMGWTQVYGDTLALIARLHVSYADGSSEEFVTDGTWLAADGPYVQADLQDGETYDARLERPGWDRNGFDASGWTATGKTWEDEEFLVPQPDEPIRIRTVLKAVSRTEPVKGAYVYDLGQNLVGVARVRLTGTAGQTVRLRHAEEVVRKGDKRGQIYMENLRKAKATDTYTFARDGTVVYQPTFTQHGFRYLEITGVTVPPGISDVEGVVLGSDLPETGDLQLSNPMLDQLVRNIRWGQRGNFLSIPTDTPARDERLGWTGDIAVFASTAARYQDTRAFLSKWMSDMRDAQRGDGNIPAIVPQPGYNFGETGTGWSDAFIMVPYSVWRATGDARILRENWEAMLRYYRFVHESATRDGNLIEEGRNSWFSGDWLSLEGVDRLAEHRLIATAYFAENTRMMAEMAAALGKNDQAAEWTALIPKIRAAFAAAFSHPDGSLDVGSQTVYAMALGMGLIEDPDRRALTAEKFIANLASFRFHLRTGFLGTPWLLPALGKIGRDDLVMKLLLNETFPSWGFEIKMGATTMWERWDGIRPSGTFGPADMNSFNHYAYGAVGDSMFARLGGVEILEPGYKKFRVAPLVGNKGLDHARCTLDTPYGRIMVEWKRDDAGLMMDVTVPPGTSAEIVLPANSVDLVREGGKPLAKAAGQISALAREGAVHLNTGSGQYRFSLPLAP